MKKIKNFNILPILLLCSCSLYTQKQDTSEQTYMNNYNQNGMIAISESLPTIKSDLSPQIVTFLAADNKIDGNWLLVDTRRRTLSIKNGDTTLDTVAIQGNIGVRPGMYSVFYKEESPLWYATDNYYYSRNMTPPEQFSKERYVKGALGNFAIFLSENIAIHDSKISTFDVQGLRIDSNDIKKVYSSLKSGALVRVY